MEFIQRKTADRAVNHFLLKAADQEITVAWDRFEGQLPECGFCESGLSCRDCLQGPCISHPFKDQSKLGVCGKDKDILAAQSLLRLVLKGTMSYLDQLNDFASGVQAGNVEPADKGQAEQILKSIVDLMHTGNSGVINEFPATLVQAWKTTGIVPRGIANDVFKASQRLEGGISDMEETLLWSFKTALLGCMADRLQTRLKAAVFGPTTASELEVNLGILKKDVPAILFYGPVSPLLKHKVAKAAEEKNVGVMGVCTDPLLPPYRFFPVTTYVSQEIPLMTGAVDLIVAGSQFVNPSLAEVARDWKVTVVPTDGLTQNADPDAFAQKIVEQAVQAFEMRQNITRDIPMVKESAIMGYSAADVDIKKIVKALDTGKIKGIAILAGSNNVKYTQDEVLVTVAKQFLANDILCISDGEASVSLAKYRLLDPARRDKDCGAGVNELLAALGENVPSVIDWRLTDFLLALAGTGNKALSDYPICAYFPEANRTAEVTKAMWTVAMGVPTYFWPCLPVTGSAKTQQALEGFCRDKFGAALHVVTQKIDARTKAGLFLKTIEAPETMSGKSWE
jgi:anaerobic carbon-monoxide dehydrogenase catalytic subunit